MIEILEHLVFWHWWIFAIALVILEILAPGVIFMWLGIGAAVTGLAVLVQPGIGWEIQFVIFAVLSVVSGIGGRIWVSRRPIETEEPNLNRRGAQYVGRVFTLDNPVVNGVGKIKVGDSIWRVSGADMPAGTLVTVTDVVGATLTIEKAPDVSGTVTD